MRWLLALLIVVILGGCQTWQPPPGSGNYQYRPNPLADFSNEWNRRREATRNKALEREQLRYYRNQNLNQYKQY